MSDTSSNNTVQETAGQSYDNGTSSSLRPLHRFITTHDNNGMAIFDSTIPHAIIPIVPPNNAEKAGLHVNYHTQGFPVDFTDDKDLKHYSNSPQKIPLATEGGSVCRIVDLGPGQQSPMHRTTSLDYGVVLAGEVDLILEEWTGPKRRMGVGDVSVQRGTLHGWRNPSPDQWCRMMYVLIPSKKLVFNGTRLEDELSGIELPR